jgi:hypothetical protein
MNIKIDIDVINNILLSYNRLTNHQKRVYGVLLGTKNLETYHATNALYGFIFEEKKSEEDKNIEEKNNDDKKTNENNNEEKNEDKIKEDKKNKNYKEKQKFNKISDEMTNNLINSYKKNSPNLCIIGGFVTDSVFFPELNNLYSTINAIKNKSIPKFNHIILLVDTFHENKEKLEFGIKAYNWSVSYHLDNNENDLSLMTFKKINYEIVQNLNLNSIINENGIEKFNLDYNINKINLKDEKIIKNLCEELSKMNDMNQLKEKNEQINYLKTQLKICEKYLEIISTYLNENISNLNNEILNKINYAIYILKPLFDKEEIIDLLNKEGNKHKILNDITNILNIQVYLTEKINKLNF